MSILKEGFLQKHDDYLLFTNWKKIHCMIKSDGNFLIGDGKHVHLKFNTKIDLKKIEIGFEAASINLPKRNHDVEAMFVLVTTHKKIPLLAASPAECREWVGAIQNSKSTTSTVGAPHAPAIAPMAPYMAGGYNHASYSGHGQAPPMVPGPHSGPSAPAFNPNYSH